MSWLHQVTKILELQLQHQSFQWVFRVISFKIDWFDLFAVQGTLKSLLQHHSSKASILWHSAFFIHDGWEDHSLEYTDLCWQSDVSTFQLTVYICHSFPAKKQSSSELMAAVTIHSAFRAQEEEILPLLPPFPFYLPLPNGTGCHILSFLNI